MPSRPKPEGFGFIPQESGHHFLVTLPASKQSPVVISEHLDWDESEARRELSFSLGREDSNVRVILPRAKWDAISEEVRAEFNRRLKKNGLKAGQWKVGRVPLSRLLGKELVLLAWAIEDADPALIPVAIKNWLGLKPEERWWLFTMTNAATGHAVNGRNKGWRKAVRYALTENPVSEPYPTPEFELFQIKEKERAWSAEADGTPGVEET